jgi:hypothetical protein
MDKAVAIVPFETEKQIAHLKQLHDSRFGEMESRLVQRALTFEERIESADKTTQLQFRERDIRTDQTSRDNKVAVDAALQAAKELVGEQNRSSTLAITKSEASVAKQIDQMSLLIQAVTKAMDDKFTDIKDRLTRLEGQGQGKTDTETAQHNTSAFIIAVIAVIISFISTATAITMAIRK